MRSLRIPILALLAVCGYLLAQSFGLHDPAFVATLNPAVAAGAEPELTYTNGLIIWHKPDADMSDGEAVAQWDDSTFYGNHSTQTTAARRPTNFVNQLNGYSIIRFDGTSDWLDTAAVLSGLTAAEVFVVIKADNDPPGAAAQGGLWVYNSGNESYYPYTSGVLYDNFFSTVRKTCGDPASSLSQWRLYNVSSQTNFWTNRIDTVDFYGVSNNIVSSDFASGDIGSGKGGTVFFDGEIAEFLLYNSVLSAANRNIVQTYLDDKFNLSY